MICRHEIFRHRGNEEEETRYKIHQEDENEYKDDIVVLNDFCPLSNTILVFKGSHSKWFVGLIKPSRDSTLSTGLILQNYKNTREII